MATKILLKCYFDKNRGSHVSCPLYKKSDAKTKISVISISDCRDGESFLVEPDSSSNSYKALYRPENYRLIKGNYYYAATKSDSILMTEVVEIDEHDEVVNVISKSKPKPHQTSIPRPIQSNETLTNNYYTPPGGGGRSVSTRDSEVIIPSKKDEYIIGEAEKRFRALTKWVSKWDKLGYPTHETDYGFLTNPQDSYNSAMSIIHRNTNIFAASNIMTKTFIHDMKHRFNRFKLDSPATKLNGVHGHIFFTRPDLNLFDDKDSNKLKKEIMNIPEYYYMFQNDPDILKALTHNNFTIEHMLFPLLSNTAKTFELSDESIGFKEVGETVVGYKIKYGEHYHKSRSGGSISIKFDDNNRLDVLKTFKMWVDYISKVFRGELSPKPVYVKKSILDYAVSAYYFLTDADNETILLWGKKTGMFPVNVPYSEYSYSHGDHITSPNYNITFEYAWSKEFDPTHILEFNNLSKDLSRKHYISQYEPSLGMVGKTFMNVPFVDAVMNDVDKKYVLKLRYRPKAAGDNKKTMVNIAYDSDGTSSQSFANSYNSKKDSNFNIPDLSPSKKYNNTSNRHYVSDENGMIYNTGKMNR